MTKHNRPGARTSHERLRKTGRRLPPPSGEPNHAIENLIVIGASAGGLKALATLFELIPQDIPAAIVVILHQRKGGGFQMAKALGRMTHLPVVTVAAGASLREGMIHIPTAGSSLVFRGGQIHELGPERPEGRFSSINSTFSSAAKAYGDRVIGVILSGVLQDGKDGLKAVHDGGGLTIVQDPAEAEFPEMPASAMKDLPVTFCLALPDIGLALDLLARRSSKLETGLAASVRMLKKRVELLVRLKAQSKRNLGSSAFLGEELIVLRQDLESITQLLQRGAPVESSERSRKSSRLPHP